MRGPAALGVALLAAACATAGSRPQPARPAVAAAATTASEAPAETEEQRLYRLVFDSGQGRVSLRVVLRTTAGARYQIVASDVAGRTVWSLDSAPDRSILVDHRERLYCVAGGDLRLTDVHPEELPLAALPRVLRGELPVAAPAGAGEAFRDAAGRRWRRGVEDGILRSWTLYDGDEPALWWTRQEDGGILSRRGGEQYRWIEVVAEPASGPLPDVVPAGFTEGICSD